MKLICFLFLIFFPFFVGATSIPENAALVHLLTHVQRMTLNYKQTKTIPEIEKPFKSSGIFQFEKNKGLIIKQEKPYSQVFVATLEKYCQGDKTNSLKDLPHFSDIKSITDHLLSGNLTDLEKIFEITYTEKNNQWQMNMIPINKEMKNFIQKIALTGNTNTIKTIIIEYTDGTKMHVNYSPIQQDLTHEIKC